MAKLGGILSAVKWVYRERGEILAVLGSIRLIVEKIKREREAKKG